jgi:hypothetical protein
MNIDCVMPYAHCVAYEDFLYGLIDKKLLNQLYLEAKQSVQYLQNDNDDSIPDYIQDVMDECWDTVWLNPLTGISHYVAANVMLPGVVADIYPYPDFLQPNFLQSNFLQPNFLQPIHIPYPQFIMPNYIVKDEIVKDEIVKDEIVKDEIVKDEIVKDEIVKNKNVEAAVSFVVAGGCGFCKNKKRTEHAWKSHLVEECIVLKNNVCDNCGKCGHTRSRCSE